MSMLVLENFDCERMTCVVKEALCNCCGSLKSNDHQKCEIKNRMAHIYAKIACFHPY